MKYGENECTPQGTRIYRGEVTSRYKKYFAGIPAGLLGFGDGLVTVFIRGFKVNLLNYHRKTVQFIRGRYNTS
jgi:hypothetical protein